MFVPNLSDCGITFSSVRVPEFLGEFLTGFCCSRLSLFVSGLYKKSGRLVFLGLGNAGKTTLLHMLNDHRLGLHVPNFDPSKCASLKACLALVSTDSCEQQY